MLLIINFRGVRRKVQVNSFAHAREAFEQVRDLGYGVSDMCTGCGDLYDTTGRGRIGHISYNGRVWDANGEEVRV